MVLVVDLMDAALVIHENHDMVCNSRCGLKNNVWGMLRMVCWHHSTIKLMYDWCLNNTRAGLHVVNLLYLEYNSTSVSNEWTGNQYMDRIINLANELENRKEIHRPSTVMAIAPQID